MVRLRKLVVGFVVMLCLVLVYVAATTGLLGSQIRVGSLAPGSIFAAGEATEGMVPTVFTYQGRLQQAGVLFSGACDFQFSLWDAANGGAQQGNTLSMTGVAVEEGLFTVQLDFGNQFRGDERWLGTAVQCPGDGAYTTLTPRQQLTAVPYALSLRPGAVVVQTAANARAIHGRATNSNSIGVWGESEQHVGVYGTSPSGQGVWGNSVSGTGVFGASDTWAGVWGQSNSASAVVGISSVWRRRLWAKQWQRLWRLWSGGKWRGRFWQKHQLGWRLWRNQRRRHPRCVGGEYSQWRRRPF